METPYHVTLSERVPPSESKGPPKNRSAPSRAAPLRTGGDLSTRSRTHSLKVTWSFGSIGPRGFLALTGACRARHCAYDARADFFRAPHNADAGQPPRYTVPVRLLPLRGRPPASHRAVAVLSRHHLATAPMGRRSGACDEKATQKAGAPGRLAT